jgi:hypothetical protein
MHGSILDNAPFRYLKQPFHFILIIFFFLLHGYAENRGLVSFKELIVLFIILVPLSLLFYALNKKILKNRFKAGVFTSLLLMVLLFYGVMEDFLAARPSLSAIARFSRLLPLTLLVLAVLFFLIRRSKLSFHRVSVFLSALFFIYIIADAGSLVYQLVSGKKPSLHTGNETAVNKCDTCSKPDIYLVLLDEYWGSEGLKTCYGYDNSAFENFLKAKGFHVVPSAYSNYSYTLFSMASMLNMDYLNGFNKDSMNMGYGYNLALKTISSNYMCRYLKQQGYAINNLSIFDLPGEPTKYYNSFVPLGANIITNKTLYNRLLKTLSVAMANNRSLRGMQDWAYGKILKNNSAAMEESLKVAAQEKKEPAFTYVHLMMPHVPLAFDSAGNNMFVKYNADNYPVAGYENAYLQYLVYTNKKMQEYITTLQQATRGNAVILLMGDHGYRGLNCSYEKKMQFSTFNAVYLPDKNYNGWYNAMSNVNQLRVLLNTVFGEKVGLVKDEVVF